MALLKGRGFYPIAVLNAGLQAVWDLRTSTGYTVLPTLDANVDALPSGWARSATYGIVTTGNDPDPFTGYRTNGRPICVRHRNAVISQNICSDNLGYTVKGACIFLGTGAGEDLTGAIVENNEIDGLGTPTTQGASFGVLERANGDLIGTRRIVRNNYFHNVSGDNVNLWTAGSIIEYNRMGVGGWGNSGAHFDCVQLGNYNGDGSDFECRYNLMDCTWVPIVYGRTSFLAVGNSGGVTAGVINFHHNVCIGFNIWGDNNTALYKAGSPIYSTVATTTATINIYDNVLNRGSASFPWVSTSAGPYGTITPFVRCYNSLDGSLITYP